MLAPRVEKAEGEIEIARLTLENESLAQQVEDIAADLYECKAELFALRPADQISEDTLQKNLKTIHHAIERWVLRAMGDYDEGALADRWKKLQKQHHDPRLDQLIRVADIEHWAHFECSNFFLLSMVIQWVLDEYIFTRPVPYSLTILQMDFVKEIEEGMAYCATQNGG